MDLAEIKAWRINPEGMIYSSTLAKVDWLIDEVERLTKEDAARKEFTVARVKVLAQKLDCTEGLPDDSTIYGCVGTILGMFRHRVEVLLDGHAKALTLSRAEGKREGLELAEKIIEAISSDSPLRLASSGDIDAAAEYEKIIAAAIREAAQEGK